MGQNVLQNQGHAKRAPSERKQVRAGSMGNPCGLYFMRTSYTVSEAVCTVFGPYL